MATPGGSKTTIISSLVEQLKTGAISKSDLFEQLAQLQQQRPAGAAPAAAAASTTPASGADAASAGTSSTPAPAASASSAASATPKHRALIQRLMEEKKQAREAARQQQAQQQAQQAQQAQQQAQQQQAQQQAPAANATPGNGAYAAAAGAAPAGGAPAAAMLSVQEYMASTPQQQMQHQAQLLQQQASALQAEQQRADAAAGQRGGAVPGQAWAWAAGGGVPGAAPGQMPPAPGQMMMMQGHAPPPPPPLSEPQGVQSERRKQRPQQQQQQQQQQSVPPYPGKSSLAQGQMQQSRAEQAAQERKEAQLSECTFKPQIRPLPSSYGTMRDKGVPFYDRVKRWQEHKKVEEDRIAKEQENAQLSECTFAPNINPNPDPTALDGSVAIAASQRLYKPKTVQKKDEVAAQAEQREKDEIARTCTFKPQINRSRTETPSAYKYWQHGQQVAASSATPLRHTAASTPGRAARAPKTPSAADPSCTFTPKINKPRPEMASAAVYLEANVFDRLSNPDGTKAAAGRENASDSAMNMHSFSSAAGSRGHSTPRRRPQSAGGAAGSAQKEKQFEDFHHRQQSRAKAREDNLRALRRHHTPSFKPDTPKAASAGPSGKNQALSQPFATRMHADLTRRNKRMLKEKMERSKDLEQCTFKPDISKSSAASGRREKRTPLEMSRGDMLKKETAHRLMKLKTEQAELAKLTFKPEMSTSGSTAGGVQGKIRIQSEPETYLQRLQQSAKAFSEKQRRAVQAQEMAEFAQCTFQPKIHDAPAYVKRIAHSMKLTRAAQRRVEGAEKPKDEWR